MTLHNRFGKALILCALTTFGSGTFASAQDIDGALKRTLNPLPDYDPFEKTSAAPRYFPDETDKRAVELMTAALTGDTAALRDNLRYLTEQDAALARQHGTVTGLADHARDLVNNTLQDRSAFLAAQNEALGNAASPERRKYLTAIINQDSLTQSDLLMRQSSTNFWGGMFNRLLGSVDLAGVASGNYIGAAVETAIHQLYSLAERDMPVEERRALVRDMEHLKRYPDDPANAKIRARVEALDEKKRAALAKKQLAKAKQAGSRHEIDNARFHAEVASLLDPGSEETAKVLARVSQDRAAVRGGSDGATLIQASAPAFSRNADVEALLTALSLRDANKIERLAVDLDRKYKGQPLSDAAKDAEAVALEMKGRHEEAKKIVTQIARSPVSPRAGKQAAALLQSPEYNLLDTVQDARSERRAETVKYVLLGEDLLRKNLLYAAGAMAVAGPGSAATLGTVNAILLGSNFYKAMTNNPVSAQPVIDSAAAYVRSHPNSANSAEVYKILADAYEERGMLDRAVSYHELAGSPKETIAALKEKAAAALLEAAGRAKDRAGREYYLTQVLDEYGASASAAEATRRLAKMVRDEAGGLRMSKQFLMENAGLQGPAGLGLKATLFDGDERNMEIADRGINLISDRELIVYYKTPWGIRSQSYTLEARASERFFVELREKNHQVAMADADRRAAGSVGGIPGLPQRVLRARSEKPNVDYDPTDGTTFNLVRTADTESFSKVLDHELLSENERNPGSKYKLPPIQGSVSASRFSMSGSLPTGLWGNELAVGSDHKGSYAGVQLPIPLLKDFIPVDFIIQGRPGGFSVYPRIHTAPGTREDAELYR